MDTFYGLPSSKPIGEEEEALEAERWPPWYNRQMYEAHPWETWVLSPHAPKDPTRGASFEMPPNVDDFFVGPFLYHLIMHYIKRVPNAATQPELYIDFIECFVGDFLVLRHNGAGRAEFIKLAHDLYQGQTPKALIRALGREWDPATNPNFYQLLAFNACRCLLEEGLPTVLSMHAPEDASIAVSYTHLTLPTILRV